MAWSPVYSTRFLLGRIHTAGTPVITYTVPADKVAVVTCMTATKQSAATAAQASFFITPSGSGTGITVWYVTQPSTTIIENALWLGRLVMHPGDVLSAARGSAASDLTVTVSGFLLSNG